ncbi:MAG: hypothetical protein GTN53_21865, partial [Candidatus Aminicenantes bacterium]|nr:hypothetical protein [Candidatus Aminicenantes bacterium]NIQ69152.1 hypothetical protein [Candidatus Aminicenantes bacterium]NIT25152.1 hypothetical protein [Candidatus Aminicenantes bacterium]
EKENENPTALLGANIGTLAMTPGEGIEAFQRVLTRGIANQLARLVHSTGDLQARVDQWVKLQSIKDKVSPTNKAAFSAFPSRPRVSTAYMAPQTLIQETIAGIWKEILGYRQVGTADDFFELGGDSLKAVT